MAVLETGATANVASFRLLEHFAVEGCRRVTTYPAPARFKFGDGRLGEVRRATDIPVGIPGSEGKFTGVALDADIPALLRTSALEPFGGAAGSPA